MSGERPDGDGHGRRRAEEPRAPRTVADVMQTEVVTASADLPLQVFVRLLADEAISGTPVVDGEGQVVGVASYADVVRAARSQTEAALGDGAGGEGERAPCAPPAADEGERASPYFRAPSRGPDLVEVLHHEELPGDLRACTVGDVMTPALFWVRPGASLAEAAALMAEGHVHRALVFEEGALVGLVTAFDLLAALSRSGGAGGGG